MGFPMNVCARHVFRAQNFIPGESLLKNYTTHLLSGVKGFINQPYTLFFIRMSNLEAEAERYLFFGNLVLKSS